MRSFGVTLSLEGDPGVAEGYVEHHRAVWPDVLAGLRGLGISRMKIFLQGRCLFTYIETTDDFVPSRDFAGYMKTGRARGWDELMRTSQEPVPNAAPAIT